MRWSHFIRTDWDGLAVDLDGSDGVNQSIKLQEWLWWWFDLNTALGDKWIFDLVFIILIVLNFCRFSIIFCFGIYENFIWLSNKHSTELINLITIFCLYISEFSEVKIGSTAPVKSFSGELIASLEV